MSALTFDDVYSILNLKNNLPLQYAFYKAVQSLKTDTESKDILPFVSETEARQGLLEEFETHNKPEYTGGETVWYQPDGKGPWVGSVKDVRVNTRIDTGLLEYEYLIEAINEQHWVSSSQFTEYYMSY